MAEYIGGWRLDIEDFAELESTAAPTPELTYSAPAKIDPREWETPPPVENQGGQGACFPAGTLVTLHNGNVLPIESIRFGHSVVTHTGESRQVVDTMQRIYTGDMYEVHVKGWRKVVMTQDHVVMVYRDGTSMWVRADELLETDSMVIGHASSVSDRTPDVIDMASYISSDMQVDGDEISVKHSAVWENRYLKLDELTCWIIGLWVAEGSLDANKGGYYHRVAFTLHEDEVGFVNRIRDFAKQRGYSVTVQNRKSSKAINVRIGSCVFARFLASVVRTCCNRKEVPHFVIQGTESTKKAFLRGYFAGDGTYRKLETGRVASSGNKVAARQVCATTASRTLFQQLGQVCVSLGYKPGLSVKKRAKHQRFDCHMVYLYSRDACDLAEVDLDYQYDFEHKRQKSRLPKFCQSGQIRPIRSINKQHVVGLNVYDFTVDDHHSFLANGLVVHNCAGHSLSSVMELCHVIASGTYKQLSRAFAYYETQRLDGIRGDRGSTISGGVKLATTVGVPPEELCRYPSSYNPGVVTSEAREAAGQFKIAKHHWLKSYEDCFAYLAAGQGGIHTGISWKSSMRGGVIEQFAGGGGGGHSVCYLGYTERKDSQGRNYLLMANSWGTSWGNRGWAEVAPTAIDQMFRDRFTAFVGLSDLSVPVARPLDWTDPNNSVFRS